VKRVSLILAVVWLLGVGDVTSADTEFFDGEFLDWSSNSLAHAGSSATASFLAGEGNPGAHVEATTNTGPPHEGGWAFLRLINNDATWDPSTDGAIHSVSMGVDVKSISGWGEGQAIHVLIEQDGKNFIAPLTMPITGSQTNWHRVALGPYSAQDFILHNSREGNAAVKPDFSRDGSPIRFGFSIFNYISRTYKQKYDNWSLTVRPKREPQKVFFAWGIAAPYTFKPWGGYSAGGATEAAECSPEYISVMESEVKDIFLRSGVENLLFVDQPDPEAVIVYIAAMPSPYPDNLPGGMALDGAIDKCNKVKSGAVILQYASIAESDSVTVAHELGHTFGLMHVDMDDGAPELPHDVMDKSEMWLSRHMAFTNGVYELSDPGFTGTQNPAYHLRRYVDGESHDELVAEGILPGTRDISCESAKRSRVHMESSEPEELLYDCTLVAGSCEDTVRELETHDQISSGALSDLGFTLGPDERLGMTASSSVGGECDIRLIDPNASDVDILSVVPVYSDSRALLVRRDPTAPEGYVVLAEVIVHAEEEWSAADIDWDGDVDFSDFAGLAQTWNRTNCGSCNGVDFNGDGRVNIEEILNFTLDWLLHVEDL